MLYEAERGLILKELGELPLEVQTTLLTFIETEVYRRIGGTEGTSLWIHLW